MFYFGVTHFTGPSLPPSALQKSAPPPPRFRLPFLRSGLSVLFFLASMTGGHTSDLAQEKEEKRAHSTSLDSSLYQRWAPLQGTLETQQLLFRKHDVEGDDAKGFCAFHLNRSEAIKRLAQEKSQEKVRNLAQPEIASAFFAKTLPDSMQGMRYRALHHDQSAAQEKLSQMVADLNREQKVSGKEASYFQETLSEKSEEREILTKALEKVSKKTQAVQAYCALENVFETYVTASLGSEKSWLGYTPGKTGLLDALAYVTHVNVFVWQRKEDEGKALVLAHQFQTEDESKNKVHLLHEHNQEAYALLVEMGERDLLFELSHKMEGLETANETLRKELGALKSEDALTKKLKDQEETFAKQIQAIIF